MDIILHPCWLDPSILHGLLQADTPEKFAMALAEVKGFGGTLVFSHTLEFLQLFGASAAYPIFSCHITKERLGDFIKAGKNSQAFLHIANAYGERGEAGTATYKDICSRVWDMLPESVEFADGCSVTFPHFYIADGSQNACKAIEVYQTWFTLQRLRYGNCPPTKNPR